MKRLLLVLALLFVVPTAARASTIAWDNGSANLSTGYYFGGGYGEFISDFTLTQAYQLTGVNFWTLGAPGNTYWAIYADNSGSPAWGGSPLATGIAAATSTILGAPVFGLDPYHNFISINASLGPGTYWLGLGAYGQLAYWAPSNSGLLGQLQSIHQLTTQYDYTSGYISATQYQEYAFNIEAAVPEPGTFLLLGTGLVLAVSRLRSFRRK